MDELRALVRRHSRGESTRTPIPRVEMRMGATTTGPLPAMYPPMLCFVLQGAKQVTVGEQTVTFGGQSYLVISVDLPATGQVIEATRNQPYMAISLLLDPVNIASLLLDLPAGSDRKGTPGFGISPLTDDLVDPLLRLMRLLDREGDIPIMAPLIEREILYRLIQEPQGVMLRQIALADSRLSQIRRAIEWIRSNFDAPLRIDALAALAGMSVATFHRHFKTVTAMSPLQYHKQIRLQEARRRLLAEPGDVARVAFMVGYESASQFNREYARQFGIPPGRDAARLRLLPEPDIG